MGRCPKYLPLRSHLSATLDWRKRVPRDRYVSMVDPKRIRPYFFQLFRPRQFFGQVFSWRHPTRYSAYADPCTAAGLKAPRSFIWHCSMLFGHTPSLFGISTQRTLTGDCADKCCPAVKPGGCGQIFLDPLQKNVSGPDRLQEMSDCPYPLRRFPVSGHQEGKRRFRGAGAEAGQVICHTY